MLSTNYPTTPGELCVTEDGRIGRYDGVEYEDRFEDSRGRDHNICMVRVILPTPGRDPVAEILPLQSLTAAEELQTIANPEYGHYTLGRVGPQPEPCVCCVNVPEPTL